MIKDVSVMLKDTSTVRNTLRVQDLNHPVQKKKKSLFYYKPEQREEEKKEKMTSLLTVER